MGLCAMCFQVVLVEIILLMVADAAVATTQLPHAKPGCPPKCGELEIPYPFGTESGCFLNENFLISCNDSKPFLWKSNLLVTNIDMNLNLVQVQSFVSKNCNEEKDNVAWASLTVSQSTTISNTQNKFTVIGCDSLGIITGMIDDRSYNEGCISWCDGLHDVIDDCSGTGCCQIDIPQGLQKINVSAHSLNRSRRGDLLNTVNPCSYAFVIEDTQFHFSSSNLTNIARTVPTAVDWAITGQGDCEEAKKNPSLFACNEYADCYEPAGSNNSHLCRCKPGFEGNAYLPDGCKDIDECERSTYSCHKNSRCVNKPGNYTCECLKGYHGNGRTDEGCVANEILTKILLGVGLGFGFLLVCGSWLYFMLKRRRLIKLKENFFHQNGGFLLQQQLSERNGSSATAKIFNEEELKKATNNFDEKRIIGKGGYGTVYKGFLIDNNAVAIKKSKIVDQSQIEQFINEVTVLSQINHRNVVKLLGCCLETEVPLLVYEYVTNGTLFDHIHNKDKVPTITWEIRLRIAAETAGVLSYLHSAAATPIIHRDVKSTNILLDDNFTAKVSDFGASKLVPMDETQLSTMVQGTLGYLDPEYLQTSQLTEKSDVYSFGVVLVELMTGKKVLSFDRSDEERNLVMYFLFLLKEGRLLEILENGIVNDDNTEQIKGVAELAKRCLRVKGDERPTMMEVAMELEGLKRIHKQYLRENVEVNIEETEHLLSGMSYTNGSGGNSTAYDSMKDQLLVAFNGGR